MRAKLAGGGLVLLTALALGVGGAGGRTAATTTTIRLEVVGVGTVGDDSHLMQCGNGSTLCRRTFAGSGSVDFTATPDTAAGWLFSGWDGDCSGSDPAECSISLDLSDQDHEVTATFVSLAATTTSTLTVSANAAAPGDVGNVSGGQIDCDTGSNADCEWQVTTGSTITLVATPDTSSVFDGWGGACSGNSVTCTLSMSADRSVTATFRKPKVSVTVSGNGTVTGGGISCTSSGGDGCSASVSTGDPVTLTATAGAGGAFTGWSGGCTGTDATCTLQVDGDRSVTATFSGAGGGGGGSTFPLSVSVSGNGSVSGGGIRCGAGETTCSANQTAGAAVTLTATPASGASFQSWSGACSGSLPTCSVTMTAAKSVVATFTGGTGGGGATFNLTVTVTGPGSVGGGGIQCGNGGNTCTAKEAEDSEVTLTATPAGNATFSGWEGACSGTEKTCTVTMDAAKSVSAAFKSQSRTPSGTTGGKALQSRGRPLVRRTHSGYVVTLRFATAQAGTARVRALRAGRLQAALSFRVARGPATVGPFTVAQPGFYVFEVALSVRRLRWTACLGRCGESAARSAGPFVLTRRLPTVVDAGPLWSVTLRYSSTKPAGVDLRVYRRARLVREVRTASRAGPQSTGLLLSPGDYTFRLVATDGYGRVRTLKWVAILP